VQRCELSSVPVQHLDPALHLVLNSPGPHSARFVPGDIDVVFVTQAEVRIHSRA